MWDAFKLRRRLNELEEQMLKLTRVIETRDLDWQDMRARCKRLLDRTEKAAQRTEEGTVQEPSTPSEATQPESVGLSARQSIIQRRILEHRRNNGILPSSG